MEPSENQVDSWLEPGRDNVKLIYILYLLSYVLGITGIVGLVFAYINRGQSAGWVESHYTYQIRTFWIGLLYGVISLLLAMLLIGFLLLFAVMIWFIIRSVIGLQKAARAEAIEDPQSWLF